MTKKQRKEARRDISDYITIVDNGYKIPDNAVNTIIAKSINKEAINNMNGRQLNIIADILNIERKSEKVYKDAVNTLKKSAFKNRG
jgi:hypothetical protein